MDITLLSDLAGPAQSTGTGAIDQTQASEDEICVRGAGGTTLTVSWARASASRRREIIVPTGTQDVRPIRAETRATLMRSIALGRRWLQEILAGSPADSDEIAAREGCSRRHVMMMISLAFLAPDLVKAAINGWLPRGVGVTRLIDAPIEWSRQWRMLGL